MKLILALALLSCAVYTCSAECSELERFKVKNQWAETFGTGHGRVLFGLKFWLR